MTDVSCRTDMTLYLLSNDASSINYCVYLRDSVQISAGVVHIVVLNLQGAPHASICQRRRADKLLQHPWPCAGLFLVAHGLTGSHGSHRYFSAGFLF